MSDLFQNVNGQIVPRDVCARKHGGNEQSRAAFETVSGLSQIRVFNMIKLFPCQGVTCDEIALFLHTTPNAISGRITELRIMGKIKKCGTRKTRSGCSAAVWVAK